MRITFIHIILLNLNKDYKTIYCLAKSHML